MVKEFDEDDIHRLSDSIGTAFYEGEGDVYVEVQEQTGKPKLLHFNNRFELDGLQFEEPSPNLFLLIIHTVPANLRRFQPVLGIDADLVIPDRRLSVYDGA